MLIRYKRPKLSVDHLFFVGQTLPCTRNPVWQTPGNLIAWDTRDRLEMRADEFRFAGRVVILWPEASAPKTTDRNRQLELM